MNRIIKLGVLAIVTSSALILGGCGEKKSVLFDKHYSQVNWDNNFYEVEKSLEDLDKDRYKITKVDNQSLEVLDKEADSNDKIVYTFWENGDRLNAVDFRANSKDISTYKVGDDDIRYTIGKIKDSEVTDIEAQKLYIDGKEIPKEKNVYIDKFMFSTYKDIDYDYVIYETRDFFKIVSGQNSSYKITETEESKGDIESVVLNKSDNSNIVVKYSTKTSPFKIEKIIYTDKYGRIVQSEKGANGVLKYTISEQGINNLREVKTFNEQLSFLENIPKDIK